MAGGGSQIAQGSGQLGGSGFPVSNQQSVIPYGAYGGFYSPQGSGYGSQSMGYGPQAQPTSQLSPWTMYGGSPVNFGNYGGAYQGQAPYAQQNQIPWYGGYYNQMAQAGAGPSYTQTSNPSTQIAPGYSNAVQFPQGSGGLIQGYMF